jgi:hypothetical protein
MTSAKTLDEALDQFVEDQFVEEMDEPLDEARRLTDEDDYVFTDEDKAEFIKDISPAFLEGLSPELKADWTAMDDEEKWGWFKKRVKKYVAKAKSYVKPKHVAKAKSYATKYAPKAYSWAKKYKSRFWGRRLSDEDEGDLELTDEDKAEFIKDISPEFLEGLSPELKAEWTALSDEQKWFNFKKKFSSYFKRMPKITKTSVMKKFKSFKFPKFKWGRRLANEGDLEFTDEDKAEFIKDISPEFLEGLSPELKAEWNSLTDEEKEGMFKKSMDQFVQEKYNPGNGFYGWLHSNARKGWGRRLADEGDLDSPM